MSFQQGTPAEMSSVLRFYVRPSGHERAASEYIERKLQRELPELQGVKTEQCYNVNWTGWASYWILGRSTNHQWQCPNVSLPCLPAAESFPSNKEMKKLTWLFGCPLLLDDVAQESWLLPGPTDLLLEVGPRQVFQPQATCSMVQSPSKHCHPCHSHASSSSCDPWEICFLFTPLPTLKTEPAPRHVLEI